MKVVGSFRDSLSRQPSEAVRIDHRGGFVLNSKIMNSRCRVPRLVVDMEEWKKKKIVTKKELEKVELVTEQDDIYLGLEMQTTGMEVAAPNWWP